MDSERWSALKRICGEVAAAPPDRREALLASLTEESPDLQDEARSMLKACEEAETRLPVPDPPTFRAWFEEPAPEAGRRFGPFRLVRELARGGMGVVYEAEQDEPRRRVALKVLRLGLGAESARRRFEQEARVLGNLSHPGIAALHGVGTHESDSGERAPYLVMELVRGARPITRFAADEKLGRDERLRLFLEVAEAVAAGHQRGIIHRDLKPDNVLVDEKGRAKVVDFGIARVTAPDLERGDVTQTGMVMGTLGYIAPEQLGPAGAGDDVRMDVYALGVILYELLTGHVPHELDGLDVVAAARTVLERRPTPATRHVPGLPQDLVWILQRALATEPEARYASVEAMARDVAAFLDDQPIRARPPSWTYQLRLFTRRHRVAVGAAVLVALTLAGAAWFSLRAARREAAQRIEATRSSERARGLLAGSQDLVRRLFVDLYDDLNRVPGTLPARLALVRRVEEGTRALRLHAEDDERFLRIAALVQFHVALLNYRRGGDHLGRPEEALAALGRAREAFGMLVARPDVAPADRIEDRRHLAVAIGNEADIHDIQGRADVAIERSDLACEMLAELVDEHPDAVAPRNSLANYLTRRARMEQEAGDVDGAIERLRAALAALPEETPAAPADAASTHGSRGYAELVWGEILRDAARHDDARPHLEAALAAFEAARAARPDDPAMIGKLGHAHGELGVLAFRARDSEGAERHLTKALALGRELHERNPQDRLAQQSLRVDLARMATLHESRGEAAEAIELQREALGIAESLAAEQPDTLFAQVELRVALNHFGGMLNRHGRTDEAVAAFERAHDLARKLLEAHPDNARVRLSWAEALDGLGIARWAAAQGKPPKEKRELLRDAKRLFEASIEEHEALKNEGLLPGTHAGAAELIAKKAAICDQNLAALDG